MNDPQPWKFTCKTCGGHEITVTHIWSILAGANSENWQEWGLLDADHRWHYDYKEKIEKVNEDDEVERGDFGEFAEDDSDSEPEEYEIIEPESDPESDEFYVNCANCDREIEFGWSESGHGGGYFSCRMFRLRSREILARVPIFGFLAQEGLALKRRWPCLKIKK